jgi:ORF6N domain
MSDLVSIETIHGSIVELRGRPAILDSDLAAYFDIETRVLNQAIKRNEERFEGYAFQMTDGEFETLRSQSVTADGGRGGRRSPPWFFTEHGVVMVATVLSSERAVKASRRIVEAFVTLKRGAAATALVPVAPKPGPLAALRSEFLPKLRAQFETLMNTRSIPSSARRCAPKRKNSSRKASTASRRG